MDLVTSYHDNNKVTRIAPLIWHSSKLSHHANGETLHRHRLNEHQSHYTVGLQRLDLMNVGQELNITTTRLS
ncbi:hypothetical protein TNCV_1620651 [Trichonephila clavipes]|nr:hypothetical protein TNCV_1620651 [Trichonephila clavipes]